MLTGIMIEVMSTSSAPQLFRANSACAKLVSCYVRREGTAVLRAVMRPLLGELVALDAQLEIDPNRPEFAPSAVGELRSLATKTLKALQAARWPAGIIARRTFLLPLLLLHLFTTTNARFRIAMGGENVARHVRRQV
jgi:hypothetical protein